MARLGQLVTALRRAVNRAGVDVIRYPARGPLHRFLRQFNVGTVLDVGANAGQYGNWLRRVQRYTGAIVSFEPNPAPFDRLRAAADADGRWTCFNVGLGSAPGTLPLHVADEDVFSSMLCATDRLAKMHKTAASQRTIDVPVLTLAQVFDDNAVDPGVGSVLLKIDTQGFERPILEGAVPVLDRIAGLQLELSFEPLYQGQPVIEDVMADLRRLGFKPYGFWNGYMDDGTGAILEVDGLFVRA